jgi:hypothetical protein
MKPKQIKRLISYGFEQFLTGQALERWNRVSATKDFWREDPVDMYCITEQVFAENIIR